MELTPEQVERRRRTARELGLRPNPPHINGRPWTEEELALLGKLPDDKVARRTGRTRGAVTLMRQTRLCTEIVYTNPTRSLALFSRSLF